jgi:hypothetical protein
MVGENRQSMVRPVQFRIVRQHYSELPDGWKRRCDAAKNIGICCVIFKLKRSTSPHFLVNVVDTGHEIPGVIEFTNWSGTASLDWDALEDGPQVNGSVLPPLHVVGAGAVGNALAYLVANLGLYAGR